MHKSVLTEELIENLNISSGETVVDGTINGAGQASKICNLIGGQGNLIGIDLDKDALKNAEEKLKDCACKKHLINDNFRNMSEILENLGIETVNKIYFDLGLSSNQLENSNKGFSFKKTEPLLMTFSTKNPDENLTASDIVNEWEEERIADVIYAYGEEVLARRIAKKIKEAREEKPIENTKELAEIVEKAVPKNKKRSGLHPARKTFQALRIAVNDELQSLRDILNSFEKIIKPGGIMAIISFHGLEDKTVKKYFKEFENQGLAKVLTKKPIKPSQEEIEENPRASSAKLRVIKRKDL